MSSATQDYVSPQVGDLLGEKRSESICALVDSIITSSADALFLLGNVSISGLCCRKSQMKE